MISCSSQEAPLDRHLEDSLAPGKLVREPPGAVRRLLSAEAQDGEVVVALLETATEQVLASGSAKAWVALTDRRALVVAALSDGDAFVQAAEASAVSHKARLGRDDLTVGELTLRCPLLRGGEHKLLASLAAAEPVERLRRAARARLEENEPAAAAALTAAAMARSADQGILALRARALVSLERFDELGPVLTALTVADPELSFWSEAEATLAASPRALWMLYQATDETSVAHVARPKLKALVGGRPTHPLLAELAVRIDADEGRLEGGFGRAAAWFDEGAIDAATLLAACDTLGKAGLDSEPLHRRRAQALAALGRAEEALGAVRRALERSRTREGLRLEAELLLGRGDPAAALGSLEALLAAGGDDSWTHGRLGEAYEALDRLDDALGARECALAHVLDAPADPPAEARERRALARIHGRLAAAAEGEARQAHVAAAALLEAGHDWAARLVGAPPLLLAGSTFEARLELIAARTLRLGAATAGLVFEERLFDPKDPPAEESLGPPPLEGWTVGRWPAPREGDEEVVHAERKTALARYGLGRKAALALPEELGRGLHEAELSLVAPAETLPTYRGERVLASLRVVVSPLGARFRLAASRRHGAAEAAEPETREGTGKAKLEVTVPRPAFCFGRQGVAEVDARPAPGREVEAIEVALVATERMRPPHRGERPLGTLCWTFPIFDYERDEGRILRPLAVQLPDRGLATAEWTWFEVEHTLRVRLLRKEKPEAVAELPVSLLHPPAEGAAPAEGASPAEAAKAPTFDADEQTLIDAPAPKLVAPGSGERTAVGPPPAMVTDDGVTLDLDIEAARRPEKPEPEPETPSTEPDPGTDWGEG